MKPHLKPRKRTLTLGVLIGVLAAVPATALFALTVVLPEHAPAKVPAQFVLPRGTDAWEAGRAAYDEDQFERAVAYWQQVPEGHPQHARSLRYIGWEVYAKELGEPRLGLDYVHRCVLVAPFEGNTWQDLGRTYAAVLGLRAD